MQDRPMVAAFRFDSSIHPAWQRRIFLAGPIRCAPNWHDEAIKMLLDKGDDNLVIASPQKRLNQESFSYVVDGGEPVLSPDCGHLENQLSKAM